MAKTLDVYRDWLGIQDAQRPLGLYALLRVKQFEDDAAKLAWLVEKKAAHKEEFSELVRTSLDAYWEANGGRPGPAPEHPEFEKRKP